MTDHSVNPHVGVHRARPHRGTRAEYAIYFALIFLLALPVGVLSWSFELIRRGRLPRLGPLGRALADARAITPKIFLA
ncbi:MAG: cytochrome PufQ [Gemmobacter sp.]